MLTSEALKILQALADGADPDTGETFPPDSVYQQPQVVRALMTAVRALERQQEREKRSGRLPANAGKPWDDEEQQRLCRDFDAGIAIRELAARHKRTEVSTRSRLEKLGKIQLPGVTRPE
jgi:hypothetical protein